MQQRKSDSSQHLEHRFDDYPLENPTLNNAAAAVAMTDENFIAAYPLSEK